MTTDLGQCTKWIFPEARMVGGQQCSNRAKVMEDGKGHCTTHSDAAQKRRHTKAEEHVQAYRKAEEAKWAREGYNQTAGNWCRAKGMTLEDLTTPIPGLTAKESHDHCNH